MIPFGSGLRTDSTALYCVRPWGRLNRIKNHMLFYPVNPQGSCHRRQLPCG
ncbi:hypothetical protein [Desulforamulus hydrothermalis]|uniref:hypothetical protein n=1 Tax=Desulforamulus hydrothermalis TaxID=412895 RepID=UPI00135F1475|nr:hypothetical protein [Desulforamulus hydrothermalis]